jgi:hypothetical protein
VARIDRRTTEADVMERVLRGIRLAHGEIASRTTDVGEGLRVWLGGVTWTAVQVSVLRDDSPEPVSA